MKRNDGVEVRRNRIKEVNEKIVAMLNLNKNLDHFQFDPIIADIEYETGLTERKILEYLTIGERRGLFILDRKNNRIDRVPQS